MKKFMSSLLISLFICVAAWAKSLDQKQVELKKIYEAGGITKPEYNKAQDFLKKSEEKKSKPTFNLSKKNKSKIKSIFERNKDKEPILEEDLAKIEIYDKKKFQDEFLEYPPEIIEFFGKNSNAVSRGKKAGSYMSKQFNKSEEGQQRFPGRMIKAMAAFEIFYIDSLRENKPRLIRYRDKKNTEYFSKSTDESMLRSLISMNKGREKMRTALGMDLNTPRKEAIKKFWYLGEFLDMGKVIKNSKHDSKLDTRKALLIEYKQKITKLKDKIKDEKKKEETIK
tara:strand:+ start:1464 stop:2309 length:846 start_codon:yes stop_codon:yes gene_type:complete